MILWNGTPGDLPLLSFIYLFFQIAHHCYKDTQNYNSMFAITCGLNHSAVMRLKNSRQRLPPKYTKLLEELTQVIVPDRNFSRYRNLISNASVSQIYYILCPYLFCEVLEFKFDVFGQNWVYAEDLRSISHFNFCWYPTLLKSFTGYLIAYLKK